MRLIDAAAAKSALLQIAEESRPIARATPMKDCTPSEYVRMKMAEAMIVWLDEQPIAQPETVMPEFLPQHKFGCPCGVVIGLLNPYCWSCGRKVKWDAEA